MARWYLASMVCIVAIACSGETDAEVPASTIIPATIDGRTFGTAARAAVDDSPPSRVDSIALVQHRCPGSLGWCPAYRLVITQEGVVRFTSHDELRIETDTIDASGFQTLVRQVRRSRFHTLPPSIRWGDSLCVMAMTDARTVTITVFTAPRAHWVEHYTGCLGPKGGTDPAAAAEDRFASLRALGRAIDSAAHTSRWTPR